MREFAPQEDLSIFGDTIDGVANPLKGHVHPYPTRYHGPIFNQPMATMPWVEKPYGIAPYSGVGAEEPTVYAQTKGAIQQAIDYDLAHGAGAGAFPASLADDLTVAYLSGDKPKLIAFIGALTKANYAYTAQALGSRLRQLGATTAGAPLAALTNLSTFWKIASIASIAAAAYHGYKRNESVGWAIWWGLMGAVAPIVTPAIAVAQGYAKPKGARKNARAETDAERFVRKTLGSGYGIGGKRGKPRRRRVSRPS